MGVYYNLIPQVINYASAIFIMQIKKIFIYTNITTTTNSKLHPQVGQAYALDSTQKFLKALQHTL